MSTDLIKIPTLKELVAESETSIKESALTVILNQSPPKEWIKEHPFVKIDVLNEKGEKVKINMPYLPIDKLEYLATRIFGGYTSRINEVKLIANSVTVTVTVAVTNPITGLTESHDGVGAVPIQTDAGKGATDFNFVKANGVQIAAPAAETSAIKDAFEKFGRIFGRDLTRQSTMNYNGLLKHETEPLKVTKEIEDMIFKSENDDDINLVMDTYPEYKKNTTFLELIKNQKLSWKK